MQKELIFIGLGRMGAAMTERLVESGYLVHGYDTSVESRSAAADAGVMVHDTLPSAVQAMSGKKVVWLMVPSKFVDDVLSELHKELQAGDIIIDGGNTFYSETIARAKAAATKDIDYVDCGTSGGLRGARQGASLMVGGSKEVVAQVEHIFTTLATTDGYAHVGHSGAGHFVKMAHNGIEYGMMGAIAEGMSFIETQSDTLGIDSHKALHPYQHGSIITSNLMDWMADAYRTTGYLDSIAGEVPKGETEEEIEFIVSHEVTPVLAAALQQRKDTRTSPSRIGTLISAMRNQFGGHKTINRD